MDYFLSVGKQLAGAAYSAATTLVQEQIAWQVAFMRGKLVIPDPTQTNLVRDVEEVGINRFALTAWSQTRGHSMFEQAVTNTCGAVLQDYLCAKLSKRVYPNTEWVQTETTAEVPPG